MGSEQLAVCGLNEQLTEAVAALAEAVHLNVLQLEDVGDLPEDTALICALTDCGDEVGQSLCWGVRLSSRYADLPLIAVVQQAWSHEVQEAFALGVDDYVPAFQIDQIKNKLLALRAEGAPTGTYLSGKVVLADPDRERRVHVGRHLRNMGLEVAFAIDEQFPDDPRVKLVVAHCELPPEGVVATLRSYRAGPAAKVPWIITGTRERIDGVRADLPDEEDVIYFDLEADPTQIVSAANKMLVGRPCSLRRSERIDYATPVQITLSQEDVQIWGYSYNVNLGGLYVRTLTPPALGTMISMCFTPPKAQGRVNVDGKVIWRQEYSSGKGYPAGFGVQYEELPAADGAALEAGYNRLLEQKGTQKKG